MLQGHLTWNLETKAFGGRTNRICCRLDGRRWWETRQGIKDDCWFKQPEPWAWRVGGLHEFWFGPGTSVGHTRAAVKMLHVLLCPLTSWKPGWPFPLRSATHAGCVPHPTLSQFLDQWFCFVLLWNVSSRKLKGFYRGKRYNGGGESKLPCRKIPRNIRRYLLLRRWSLTPTPWVWAAYSDCFLRGQNWKREDERAALHWRNLTTLAQPGDQGQHRQE